MMNVIFIACYCILGLVTVLVCYASYRFRAGRHPTPRKQFGNKLMERTWTGMPVLLLASMFGLTAVTMRSTDPDVPRDKIDLIVIGHQWWWEVRYPQSGAVTSFEVHVPVGRSLATQLQSADVIHDFAVMQLGRKMDAIPSYWNYFWVGADQPGTYQGFCP